MVNEPKLESFLLIITLTLLKNIQLLCNLCFSITGSNLRVYFTFDSCFDSFYDHLDCGHLHYNVRSLKKHAFTLN